MAKALIDRAIDIAKGCVVETEPGGDQKYEVYLSEYESRLILRALYRAKKDRQKLKELEHEV